MKKTGSCPKCGNNDILIIKDIFHASAGGNISTKKHFMSERNSAFVSFYICKECGFVEHYLDQEELEKIIK